MVLKYQIAENLILKGFIDLDKSCSFREDPELYTEILTIALKNFIDSVPSEYNAGRGNGKKNPIEFEKSDFKFFSQKGKNSSSESSDEEISGINKNFGKRFKKSKRRNLVVPKRKRLKYGKADTSAKKLKFY